MADSGFIIEVDASDVAALCAVMKASMTQANFDKAINRAVKRTAKGVKRIVSKDVPQNYKVTSGQVGKTVFSPQYSGSGGSISCAIPIRGERGKLGRAGLFKNVRGGAHGWNVHPYNVRAEIVRGRYTTMSAQGGVAPFRNLSAVGLNGLAFTRKGKSRLPIKPIVGIAVPQMPLNLSEPSVQQDIADRLYREVEHECLYFMGRK